MTRDQGHEEPPLTGSVQINGPLLDFALRAAGMTQTDLAKKTGLSKGHISRVISGKSGTSVDGYGRILAAFGKELKWPELLAPPADGSGPVR